MKKSNIQIKFYTVQWSKNTIDRALPINDKGQYVGLDTVLPRDFNYEIPFYVPDSKDSNNGVNHKLTKSIEFETQDSIRIDIAAPNLPHFNYAVVECLTDEIFHLRKSYFFVRKSDSYSAKFTKLTLEMDFFASFGAQYLEGIEGKQVDYAKRHIDRWLPNKEQKSKEETTLPIRNYKNSAGSRVNLDFPGYGKDDINSTSTIYDWVYKEFGNKTEAVVGNIKTYKTSGNSYSRTFNKPMKLSKNDKGETVLTVEETGSTLTFYFKLVVVEVNTLVLARSSDNTGVLRTVYLPKQSGKVWDKDDIKSWVSKNYGKGKDWEFETDMDAYIADASNYNLVDKPLISLKGDTALSVFGNLNDTTIFKDPNRVLLQILTEDQLKAIYAINFNENISDLSITLYNRTYSDTSLKPDKYVHVPIDHNSDWGKNTDQTPTYGGYIVAPGWVGSGVPRSTINKIIANTVYATVSVKAMEFLKPVQIRVYTEGLSDYQELLKLRAAITSPLTGDAAKLPSASTYTLSVDKSKLPHGVTSVKLLSQTNNDFAGVKTLKLEIENEVEPFIMNTDKTSEIWTNNEYQDISQANGATDHYTPLKLLNTDNLNNSTKHAVEKHINSLPYTDDFGIKQRVFYGLASKMTLNKLSTLSDNEFYVYAVLPTHEMDEVRSNFTSAGQPDLTKVSSIETPYTFIPLMGDFASKYLTYNSDGIAGDDGATAIFKKFVMSGNDELQDEISGYSIRPYSALLAFFKQYNKNNNARTIKEYFADKITKLIVSPVPLVPRVPQIRENDFSEAEALYSTYFTKIKAKGTNNKIAYFAAVKVDYKNLSNFITIDFKDLSIGDTFNLPKEVPKKIGLEYLESNAEVALLNNNYEKHEITQLLSRNPIPLNNRKLYESAELIVSPKITGSGVAHDIKFKGENRPPSFVLHDFSLPFGVNEGQKVLQQQSASAQANLDNIRRQTEATNYGIGISSAFGALGSVVGGYFGGGSAGALVASGAFQGVASSIQARVQEGYNDQAQRAQINAAIADAGRRPSPIQEPILPESVLNSPFIAHTHDDDASGYNLQPFNLKITKPNTKLSIKVAKAFNDNGYASNTSEPFSNTNLKSRYYWNFIQLANVDEISQDLYLPQLAKDTISAILANGVRIHWFRKSPTIDRTLHNHEVHLLSAIKK